MKKKNKVFVDGSIVHDKRMGGAGVVITNLDVNKVLFKFSYNLPLEDSLIPFVYAIDAEMYAIILGLETAVSVGLDSVDIIYDNLQINHIMNHICFWQYKYDIFLNILNEYSTKIDFKLVYLGSLGARAQLAHIMAHNLSRSYINDCIEQSLINN